jgi:Tat protein translocase TatB subunit
MFGIGMPELFVIMAIALIVIGPKKLPDLARTIGRALGEFKKATGELKSSLGVDEDLSDVKNAFNDINQEIKDTVNINPLEPDKTKAESTVSDTPDGDDVTGDYSDTDETMEEATESAPEETDPTGSVKDVDGIDTPDESSEKKDQGETIGGE